MKARWHILSTTRSGTRHVPILTLDAVTEVSLQTLMKFLDGASFKVRQLAAQRKYLFTHPDATDAELFAVAWSTLIQE